MTVAKRWDGNASRYKCGITTTKTMGTLAWDYLFESHDDLRVLIKKSIVTLMFLSANNTIEKDL